LLGWWLLYLGILGDINGVELSPTSTEICKQIRDICELFLDILNLERGIQGFYAFLGVKYRDDVVLILGLSHCWNTARWTIAYRRRVIGLERYDDFIRKVSLPLILIIRFVILEILNNFASSEHEVLFILTGKVDHN
jgi:hypothetical protein